MAEKGYDLSSHHSKSLDEVGPGPWDYVVTMGCGDECPWIPTRERLDWDVADPKDLSEPEARQVRDEIERRVLALLAQGKPEQG
jgi:protein-tyrosine-phosphatase